MNKVETFIINRMEKLKSSRNFYKDSHKKTEFNTLTKILYLYNEEKRLEGREYNVYYNDIDSELDEKDLEK